MIKRSLHTDRVITLAILLIVSVFVNSTVSAAEAPQQVLDLRKVASECIKAKNIPGAIGNYQAIIQGFPGTKHALDAQSQIVITHIDNDALTTAKTELTRMLSTYSSLTEDIDDGLNSAIIAYNRTGNYQQAIEYCQYMLAQWPNCSRAMWAVSRQAHARIMQGNLAEAERLINIVKSNYSDEKFFGGVLCNNVADTYIEKGRSDKALSIWQDVSNEFPAEPISKLRLALYYIERDDLSKASLYINQLKQNCPEEDAFKALFLLENKYKKEHPDFYIDLCRQVVLAWPNGSHSARAQGRIVVALIGQKDMAAAEAELQTFWANYSSTEGFVEVVNRIRHAYWSHFSDDGNMVAHQALCVRILAAFPDHPRAPEILANEIKGYIICKDMATAATKLETLWTKSHTTERFVRFANKIRNRYWWAGEYAAHQALCVRILAAFPDHPMAPEILANEIKGYVKLNDMATAEIKTEEFFAKYSSAPGFIDSIRSVCNSFIRKNDLGMALQYINRALQASPDNEKILRLLKIKAACYADMGAKDQADTVIDEIIQNHSTKKEFPLILNEIANICRKNGNHARSIELYQQTLDNNLGANRLLSAHTGIGMNYVWLGDDAKVQSKVDLILASYKDHSKAGYSVFVIGEEYYKNALQATGEQSREMAKDDYKKAISIWKKNIDEIQDPFHRCFAYYYTGACYQSMGDYRVSLANYHKVFNDYPDSEHAGNALLMIGRIYQKVQRDEIDINSAIASMGVSDPNEPMGIVAFRQASEPIDLDSATTMQVEADAVSITSTKAAYELLLEKYPDGPGAGYARHWLSKQRSN